MIWLLLAVAFSQEADDRIDDLELAIEVRAEEVAELQELTAALLAALDIEDQGPPAPEPEPEPEEPEPETRDSAPLASPLSNYPERD